MDAPKPFEISLPQFVIKQLVQEGRNESEVIDMLVKSGIDQKTATEFVYKIAEIVEEQDRKDAWKAIVIGLIMTIAGGISTLALYAGGWIVSVTIGITIIGIYILVKGINNRYNIY